ncbi:group III truncated hemoglobin [Roseibium aggregatum]|uniref:Group III truncated hemoglobin n=1 Tax=Roseibium aggregatum TaxID=187304 RepID=A0A926S957_9HYPH|nr:group III truncated hemoglobin [Roseibium aggregatum]MBD1546129.1 group III truncated hemoglobin [Roseibium aggregatum]
MEQSIDIRPAVRRQPAHPSIDSKQISALVDTFYGRIQEDDRLGPVFDGRLNGRWEPHLEKMKAFWRSVLLKTGEYKGQPVPTHTKLKEVVSDDYRIWLELFRETAFDVFKDEAAARIVIRQAEKIAESLWMATIASPFDRVPDFLSTADGWN